MSLDSPLETAKVDGRSTPENRERLRQWNKANAKPRECPKCGKVVVGSRGTLTSHVKWCGREVEIFWNRVSKAGGPDACWPHAGCRDKWGYAQHGVKHKRVQAHRHAYELSFGPIPQGMLVMHTCDNPPCCNPQHFRLGTNADNRADCVAKGRYPRGEAYSNAKLTEADARHIKATYRKTVGRKSNAPDLAKQYQVNIGAIYDVVFGRTWKHVK